MQSADIISKRYPRTTICVMRCVFGLCHEPVTKQRSTNRSDQAVPPWKCPSNDTQQTHLAMLSICIQYLLWFQFSLMYEPGLARLIYCKLHCT